MTLNIQLGADEVRNAILARAQEKIKNYGKWSEDIEDAKVNVIANDTHLYANIVYTLKEA